MDNDSIRKFRIRRYRHSLVLVLAGFGLGLTLLGLFFKDEFPYLIWVIWFGVFLWFGSLIFTWVKWRCPNCEKYLGRERNPRFCPQCGITLDESS
jgi:hypothetical protein